MIKCKVLAVSHQFSNISTVSQWNCAIREAVNQGKSQKALTVFRQMKLEGLKPNHLTFPIIAKACGKLGNLRYSEIIRTHIVKSPFSADIYVQSAMVDMFIKCNHIDCAYELFERMPHRDLVSWNSMLMGFAQLGTVDWVMFLFKQMRALGIQPDSVSVIGVTQSLTSREGVKIVKAIHSFGIRIGVEGDVSVSNTWISAYAKVRDLGSAEKMFDGIDLGFITVVSWNSMIAGCAYVKRSTEAVSFYKRMLYNGFRPDLSTILNLLSSISRLEALFIGKLIHCHGIKAGCASDISVLNTLLSMYSKCGDLDSGRQIFDGLMYKTCVSWTAMIGGYAEKGDLDEALSLFYSMEAAGEKPDLVTVLNVIAGCGEIGALEAGRWIDNYATSKRFRNNLMVSNALIDMYAKCGSINFAHDIFCSMHERTVVSWTSMVAGYALNGNFKEALEYFFCMLEFGEKPNHVTFLAVLQACNHGGFVEKGWEIYDLMTNVHRLDPGIDHYACMADLLGRGGKLKEALDFIQNMPVKPDAGIWASLLSACKIHHNVEIGEFAARHLFELDPQTSAPYVEMANIYASAGRWDGVAAVRKMMKHNQVLKSPGQSTIQVSGKTHSFTVQDKCHPEGSFIYEALDNLSLLLKGELDSTLQNFVLL